MRAGNFTANDNKYAAYHFHSTSQENADTLKQAIYEYSIEQKTLPKVFHLKIALQWFPNNPGRERKAKPIADRLIKVYQSLKGLFELMLNHTVNQGISLEETKKITALTHIVSFNYELSKGNFFIRL